jgi:P-type Ca2+ transporter type 2C
VTDGLLDITIALEPKEGDVMHQPPRPREASIVTQEILRNIVFVALFMAAGTLYAFIRSTPDQTPAYAQTMAFTTMAMFQVFNSLNVRSRSQSLFQIGPFSNRYLVGAIIASVLLQIAATTVPFLQVAFGTVPLGISDWALIVAVSSSIFVADELRKLVTRRRAQREQ